MNNVVIADILKDVLQKKKRSIYARSPENYLNFLLEYAYNSTVCNC